MSLRLLRSEVWSLEGRKRLNRVTARVLPDTALHHLAVVAHARLVVIAHENAGGPPRTGRVSRRRRNSDDPLLLLPDASASVNAPAGFFKRGDR
jgi:hypothetical protein